METDTTYYIVYAHAATDVPCLCNWILFLCPLWLQLVLTLLHSVLNVFVPCCPYRWVQIACPRLSIDWGTAFSKPLLSPYEVNTRFSAFSKLSVIYVRMLKDERETHTERKTFHHSQWRVWVYEKRIKACCLCSIVQSLHVCYKADRHTKTSAKEWPPLLATISHPPTSCSPSVPLIFWLCRFHVFLWGG